MFFAHIFAQFNQIIFYLGCSDKPSWYDGLGHDCNTYAYLQWCENGAAKPGTGLGAIYNYPEKNCCVCGKGNFSNNLRDLNYITFTYISSP